MNMKPWAELFFRGTSAEKLVQTGGTIFFRLSRYFPLVPDLTSPLKFRVFVNHGTCEVKNMLEDLPRSIVSAKVKYKEFR